MQGLFHRENTVSDYLCTSSVSTGTRRMRFLSVIKRDFTFGGLCMLTLFIFANNAWANFCEKKYITDRYRDEVKLIKSESYTPASPDYIGNDEYNAN